MTSALYLENYLDGLEHLPAELRRNFNLMRELDNRVQTLMKNIDKDCNDFMKNASSSDSVPVLTEDNRRDKLKAIQDMFNKAKQLGDDKVQLAIQTYELVDKHIRRLDADLQRFEGEIQDKNPSAAPEENVAKKAGRKKGKTETKQTGKKKRAVANSSDDESKETTTKATGGAGAGNGPVGAAKNKKQKVNQDKENRNKGLKKSAETDSGGGHVTPHPSDVLDMPVDPNEPTYCLCHQVSYGEMIGCDNELCPIEWFHFACVGLTTKPKGKWFCPKCSLELRKKNK